MILEEPIGLSVIGILEGPIDTAIALANAARSAEGCPEISRFVSEIFSVWTLAFPTSRACVV